MAWTGSRSCMSAGRCWCAWCVQAAQLLPCNMPVCLYCIGDTRLLRRGDRRTGAMLRLGVLLILLCLGVSAESPSTGAPTSADVSQTRSLIHRITRCACCSAGCFTHRHAAGSWRGTQRSLLQSGGYGGYGGYGDTAQSPLTAPGTISGPAAAPARPEPGQAGSPASVPRARPRALTARCCQGPCCYHPWWQPGSCADRKPCEQSRSCASWQHEPCQKPRRSASRRCKRYCCERSRSSSASGLRKRPS